MKERLCEFQDTMFASNLGLLVSRCLNKECEHFTMSLTKDICVKCKNRVQPLEKGEGVSDISDVKEVETRSPKDVRRIFNRHCKKCEDRIGEHFCKDLYLLPIKELLKLPDIVCPRGLWK